ncbi:MAG: hypothetical protein COB59_03730 [Rhodospirillaceae bacterium]|nr:MAG: hypothetical protein COB59_03730 [Rhodospirillaceae bacterium]
MSNQSQNTEAFFLGVMVLKGGKWLPHSKFAENDLGQALYKAEEVDKDRAVDGTKILKISTSGQGAPKEMWVSPRFAAKAEAEKQQKLQAGRQKTQENLATARRADVKKS